MTAGGRIEHEREFFDRQYTEDNRRAFDRFYSVSEHTYLEHVAELEPRIRGKKVLEFGCGDRPNLGIAMARAGADVHSFDLSPVAVDMAREMAGRMGADIQFHVMNGEQLEFPDDSFDAVVGHGVIHHLDLSKAYAEMMRVLRPEGFASFVEPWGHSPIVNWYRRRTPAHRTPDEHPLLRADVDLARRFFGRVDVRYHDFVTLLAIPLAMTQRFGYGTKTLNGVVSTLNRVDRRFFDARDERGNFAWLIRLRLEEPSRA